MTTDDLTKTIVAVLKDLQDASGRVCGQLHGDTKPIGDLVDFDSLSGIEATVALEAVLGKELGTDNVFVSEVKGRNRALTIAETAGRLVQILATAAV
jgi:hypothetical protein